MASSTLFVHGHTDKLYNLGCTHQPPQSVVAGVWRTCNKNFVCLSAPTAPLQRNTAHTLYLLIPRLIPLMRRWPATSGIFPPALCSPGGDIQDIIIWVRSDVGTTCCSSGNNTTEQPPIQVDSRFVIKWSLQIKQTRQQINEITVIVVTVSKTYFSYICLISYNLYTTSII